MSVHRRAALFGGAVVLAATLVPATIASAATGVSVAPTATLVSAGSVFRVDVTYKCTPGTAGGVSIEAHQNVGGGFVANGWGYARSKLTCDNKNRVVRLTVAPAGERGFKKGNVFVIADVSSCNNETGNCELASVERTIKIQ
jgi:hypothetical protein